jgi:MoaA/NifB/PqqE/SkfB family radical SAM enzyme
MNYIPHEIQIRVSLRCNIFCRHCYNDSGPTKKLSLNLSNLNPLLNAAKANGVWRVSLTGGEIFLFPDSPIHFNPMFIIQEIHKERFILCQ